MIYYHYFQHIFCHTPVGLNNKLSIIFFFFNSYWFGFQKYSCPALALAAIGGKNKACSGGNGGTRSQNKACWDASVAAGANVTRFFLTTHKLIREYEPIRQFKLSVLLCILCKCNCRRSSSHCKSATQFAPQKCVSLITEKFPKEEGGQWLNWVPAPAASNEVRPRNQSSQWPTSVTHAKVTYLRPRTRLFHSATLRRLGLCCDRSKPPRQRRGTVKPTPWLKSE